MPDPLILNDLKKCKVCPNLGKRHVASLGNRMGGLFLVGLRPWEAEEIADGVVGGGSTGRILTYFCDELDRDRDEVYMTNLVKCPSVGHRSVPEREEVDNCTREWFFKEVAEGNPKLVIVFGRRAWEGLFPETDLKREKGERPVHGDSTVLNGIQFWYCYSPEFWVHQKDLSLLMAFAQKVKEFLEG